MTLLEKLFAAGKALRAGESLKDPAAWKNKQLLFTAILTILSVATRFLEIDVPDQTLNSISAGFADFAIVLNLYLTPATSEKIGLPNKNKGSL